MALPFLEREMRELLREAGYEDLAATAIDRIALTDDGSTVYVHLWPRIAVTGHHPGQAFPLSWRDYEELQSLADYRQLMQEARYRMLDDLNQIIRWLLRR